MSEKLDRFVKLLKEIFELDKSDLDFGIYRVLNLRKAQIERFLTHSLPQMVKETLEPFAQKSKEEIRAEMYQIEQDAIEMGMTVDTLSNKAQKKERYRELQKQLAEGADLTTLETDVYSALYSFFNRYYEDGDFISKRRYKEDVYAIPYEGEEVKLYWANQDQYYIKTSENFKDYTFVFDDISVHFRLVDATTEQDNNKESTDGRRTFMLFTEDEEKYPGIRRFEYNPDLAELVIRFVYDIPEDRKKKYAEENFAAITTWLISLRRAELNPLLLPVVGNKDTTTLLEKHLKRYVAKNTFDYFIHKDLRKFLTRELDFFIKNEIMHLEDLDTDNEAHVETYLSKVKAIKRVGKVIIDFLAQIEDFQKKLWLKKKFIVETDWCITLDKIEESFWSEIVANKAQLDEWIALYAIDEAEGWANPPTIDFLRQNQNLIIDTKYFSDAFKYALLESIPNLDERTNGLMINGDNFHALSLLNVKYHHEIGYCYIDPPYNTNSSPILYKNGYRDSSWNSLISDRINLANLLLKEGSVITVAIDHTELYNLGQILDSIYGIENRIAVVTVQHNPKGRNQAVFFSENVEYMLEYSNNIQNAEFNDVAINDAVRETFTENDNGNKYRWESFVRARSSRTKDKRPDNWYPLYVSEDLSTISIKWCEGLTEVFPVVDSGEFTWKNIKSTFDEMNRDGYFKAVREKNRIAIYHRYYENQVLKNLWIEKKYQSEFNGTNLLKDIFGKADVFSYPKSLYTVSDSIKIALKPNEIVIDYFAGSGTTGHAVMHLNREDNGNRKYILVEMGEYFDTVTKPRMQKIIYSADWKNGKPQNRNTGVSQIIKYMRLESYEDALSNIELSDKGNQWASLFGEEYIIRYMLPMESRDNLLNIEKFSNPFAYSMKITEKNECKSHPVDLIETFNYLIGLTVISQSAISYYLSKPATNPTYEGAVELVSDINGEYAFRQVEGLLPDGRRALVIWRIVTEDIIASNAVLDAYFTTRRPNAMNRKYDVIFVNGDNNLENLRDSNENWTVRMIEIEFKKLMFEEI